MVWIREVADTLSVPTSPFAIRFLSERDVFSERALFERSDSGDTDVAGETAIAAEAAKARDESKICLFIYKNLENAMMKECQG